VDVEEGGTFIIAPDEYHGDWSVYEEAGAIGFDHKLFDPGDVHSYTEYEIHLIGEGGRHAIWDGPMPVGATDWLTFTIPFKASLWNFAGDWSTLLTEVTLLEIRIELVASNDRPGDIAGIDNVRLISVAPQYDVPRDVTGNGGARQVAANLALHGTIGQAAIGRMAGSFYQHNAGFWIAMEEEGPSDIGDYETELPAKFSMTTAFPNPVRSVGILRFAVPQRSPVSIELYDVSGRRVRTLVKGPVDAGVHEVELTSEGLASGIYFCRMKAERFKQTRRLVLLK
jgi:hypothetical protein